MLNSCSASDLQQSGMAMAAERSTRYLKLCGGWLGSGKGLLDALLLNARRVLQVGNQHTWFALHEPWLFCWLCSLRCDLVKPLGIEAGQLALRKRGSLVACMVRRCVHAVMLQPLWARWRQMRTACWCTCV